jgi:hypothetical protein
MDGRLLLLSASLLTRPAVPGPTDRLSKVESAYRGKESRMAPTALAHKFAHRLVKGADRIRRRMIPGAGAMLVPALVMTVFLPAHLSQASGRTTAAIAAITAIYRPATHLAAHRSSATVIHSSLSITDTCPDQDETSALQSYFNSLPSGTPSDPTVVNFPQNACYTINDTPSDPLTLANDSWIKINGNGTTFVRQQDPCTYADGDCGGVLAPIMELLNNNQLELDGFTLDDQLDQGVNKGDNIGSEGLYGIYAISNSHLELNAINMNDIVGDFMIMFPNNVCSFCVGPNEYVTVKDSTWTNGGYHGITVESANGDGTPGTGLDFVNDTIDGVNYADGIDLEEDAGSAPENDVQFSGNTFENVTGDMLNVGNDTSVPVQDLVFSGNDMINVNPAFHVVGTSDHPVQGFIETNNTDDSQCTGQPYCGGSGPSDTTSTSLYYVNDAVIANNYFPEEWYPVGNSAYVYRDGVWLGSNVPDAEVENNTFVGAVAVTGGNGPSQQSSTQCGNTYLVNAYQYTQMTQPSC